jgi:hypothetical protein
VGPRAGLDLGARRKSSAPVGDQSPLVQPVVRQSYYQQLKTFKSEMEASVVLKNCKTIGGPDKNRLWAGGCPSHVCTDCCLFQAATLNLCSLCNYIVVSDFLTIEDRPERKQER